MAASTSTANNRPVWADEMIGAYVQFPEAANDSTTYKLVDVERSNAFAGGYLFAIAPIVASEAHKVRFVGLDAWDQMISVGVN